MRVIIPNKLWIGHALDARNITLVMQAGIAAVIDLAKSEPAIQYPREIVYCRFPLDDGGGNDRGILRAAIGTTSIFFATHLPTLVSCSAGMSRSPAIVAAAIAIVERIEPSAALTRVSSLGPHDICPGLWSEVCNVLAEG